MGAVRQVARDRFKPSDAVLRYRCYRDEVRLRGVTIPEPYYHMVFVLAMPDSWSERRKVAQFGQPHLQKPDKDNLEKGVLDAVLLEDKAVWDGRVTKLWGRRPLLIVSPTNLPIVLPVDLERFEAAAYDPGAQIRGYQFAP